MMQAAALALDVPRGVSLAPPKGENRNGCMPPSTLLKLAALEPCEDREVALPEVCLLMTELELAIIKAKAEALGEAQAALVAAEQALAKAQTLARQVPALKQAAGVAAAAGFSGKKTDRDAVQRASAELAEAEQAASAVKVLEDEQRAAKEKAALALGSLRGNAQTAVMNALHRQAREYERLAREMVRVTGHLLAGVELLNDRDLLTDAHCMFLPMLQVPAPMAPLVSDHAAVEVLSFRPTLLAHSHAHLTAMQRAARGWLTSQLQTAAGLPAARLMK